MKSPLIGVQILKQTRWTDFLHCLHPCLLANSFLLHCLCWALAPPTVHQWYYVKLSAASRPLHPSARIQTLLQTATRGPQGSFEWNGSLFSIITKTQFLLFFEENTLRFCATQQLKVNSATATSWRNKSNQRIQNLHVQTELRIRCLSAVWAVLRSDFKHGCCYKL